MADLESVFSASVTRGCCPGCGGPGPFGIHSEAVMDEKRFDELAFASRKAPELMHHRLVICPDCDLLLANPVPRTDAVERAYAEAAFDSAEEARWASRTYIRLISDVRAELPDSDGVLDIGTGEGSFLEELVGNGFRGVVGVEPSAAPVAAAAPEIRACIRQETFNALAFEPVSFSLITCFQTLEHVFEPGRLVRDALRLLKPGGAFVAVSHNRHALSARVLGERSPIFDVEHLQLFTKRSSRVMLARAGYERVQAKMIFNRYPIRYWARLLPGPAGRLPHLLERLRRSALGRVGVALPAGNHLLVGFKPR